MQVTYSFGEEHEYRGMLFDLRIKGNVQVSMQHCLVKLMEFAEVTGVCTNRLFEILLD